MIIFYICVSVLFPFSYLFHFPFFFPASSLSLLFSPFLSCQGTVDGANKLTINFTNVQLVKITFQYGDEHRKPQTNYICSTGYQIKLKCKGMHKLSSEISLKISLMHNVSRDNITFNLQRLHYSCA